MNTFQKYISYLQRITIDKRSTPHNKKLVVAIQNGKYVMNADHANYSFASLHRVFQKALDLVQIDNETTILVLGCGAGSIPSILHDEKGMSPSIDAIEIDPVVIELGKQYFGLGNYPNLTVEVADASDYVAATQKKYDLICMDVFDGLNVPDRFLSSKFIEHCARVLNDEGRFLLNFVAHNHETKQKVHEIEQLLKHHFSTVQTHKIEGINRIFSAKK